MKQQLTLDEKVEVMEREIKELRTLLRQFIGTTEEYAQSLDATNAAMDSVMARIGLQRINGARTDEQVRVKGNPNRDTLEHLTLSSKMARISSAVSKRHPTATYVNFYTTTMPGVVGVEFSQTPVSDLASSAILWLDGTMHLKNLATVNTVFRFALAGTNTTCKFWKLDQDPHAENRMFAWPVELKYMFDQTKCAFVAPFQSQQQAHRPITVAVTGNNSRWCIRLQSVLPNIGNLSFKTADIEAISATKRKFTLHEDMSGKYKVFVKTGTAVGLLEIHSKPAIQKLNLLPDGQDGAQYTAVIHDEHSIVISVDASENEDAKLKWQAQREQEKAVKRAREQAEQEAAAAAALAKREAARCAYAENNTEDAEVTNFAALFS